MAANPGEAPALFSPEGHGTLRVAAWLLLAVMLMVIDHRTGALDTLRAMPPSVALRCGGP